MCMNMYIRKRTEPLRLQSNIGLIARPQSRPRDFVTLHCNIRVEKDSRVILVVEAGSNSSLRVCCARTRHVNVDAERIVLRAIERGAAVACDDFVAEDVVACHC